METKDERKVYILNISFWAHDSGPVQVPAKDEAHARELLPKLLGDRFKDITILDVYEQGNIVRPDVDVVPPEAGAAPQVIH